MKKFFAVLAALLVALVVWQVPSAVADDDDDDDEDTFVTWADASEAGGGTRGLAGTGDPGVWEQGEVFYFEQPLLADDDGSPGEVIGRNAGFCIATDPGNAFFECTWTLTFTDGTDDRRHSITVAGQEYGAGESWVAIVGGTGRYAGVSGEMHSIPVGSDPELRFRQTLHLDD